MTSVGEQGCCGGAPTAREDAARPKAERKDGCGCKNDARGTPAAADASNEGGTSRTSGERRSRCC